MTVVLGGALLALRVLGIALAVLLAAVGILLLQPIGLDIRWSQRQGAVWQAKVGPLRFPLYPFPEAGQDRRGPRLGLGGKKKGRGARKSQNAAPPAAEQAPPRPAAEKAPPAVSHQPAKADHAAPGQPAPANPSVRQAPQAPLASGEGLLAAGRTLAGALWPQRARLLRRLRVRHLRVFWTVTGEDAADTAIRYGVQIAACNTMLAAARDHLSIQSDSLRLEPDFTGKQKEERSLSCQILSRVYIIGWIVWILMQKDEKTGRAPLQTVLTQLGS